MISAALRVTTAGVLERRHRHVTDLYGVIHHWYGAVVQQNHVLMYVVARVDITTPVCIVNRIQGVMTFVRVMDAVKFYKDLVDGWRL